MFGLFLGDNETLEDVRASVTVTNGPVTLGILLGLETQTLQVLDELQGLVVVPFLLGNEKIIGLVVVDIDVSHDGFREGVVVLLG